MTDQSSLQATAKSAVATLSNFTSYLWERDDSAESSLVSDQTLISLGDALYGVFARRKISDIKIPQIIVVGTQSSGKSSVLNSLVGMDILPTGKQMCTRTPLRLELVRVHNGDAPTQVEFGEYRNGTWNPSWSSKISYPSPSQSQQQMISEQIEELTNQLAGDRKDISDQPIYLRVSSPHVTNLSLVDLPGLTAVACTDKGQPKDIKIKLDQLVGSFASSDKTIILAVMAGRADLEADMGLEAVKRYDPKGERTIGVITKLDLMNDSTDIAPYLDNRVSRDLQLHHGYFAVRNRNCQEKDSLSVLDGIEREQTYFASHPIFKQDPYPKHTGITSLRSFLSKVLVESIKESLPSIQSQIQVQLTEVDSELQTLGDDLPSSDEAKLSYLHTLLVNYSRDFTSCISDRGSSASTGRNIRNIMVQCRESLGTANIFQVEPSRISNEALADIVLNSEGNHMSFPYPPVEILERCLQDTTLCPIKDLLSPIQACNSQTTQEMVKLVGDLIDGGVLARFPNLHQLVKTQTIQGVIIPASTDSTRKLQDLIEMQTNYIWTDNPEFRTTLLEFGKEEFDRDIIPTLRRLLAKYITSITEHLRDVAPKAVMLYLVKQTTQRLYEHLYRSISSANVAELLQEDNSVWKRRNDLQSVRNDLLTAKSTIEKVQ